MGKVIWDRVVVNINLYYSVLTLTQFFFSLNFHSLNVLKKYVSKDMGTFIWDRVVWSNIILLNSFFP